MNVYDVKITDKQAKSFAVLILPVIREYIKDHPEEYEDYLREEQAKRVEHGRERD